MPSGRRLCGGSAAGAVLHGRLFGLHLCIRSGECSHTQKGPTLIQQLPWGCSPKTGFKFPACMCARACACVHAVLTSRGTAADWIGEDLHDGGAGSAARCGAITPQTACAASSAPAPLCDVPALLSDACRWRAAVLGRGGTGAAGPPRRHQCARAGGGAPDEQRRGRGAAQHRQRGVPGDLQRHVRPDLCCGARAPAMQQQSSHGDTTTNMSRCNAETALLTEQTGRRVALGRPAASPQRCRQADRFACAPLNACDSWSGAMCKAVRSPVQDPRPPHRQQIRPYSGRVGAGRGAAGSRWRRLPPRPFPACCVDLIDRGLLCAVDAAVTSPTTRLQPCHGRLFEGRMRRRQRARSRADLAGGGHPGPHHSGAPGGSRSSPRSPLQPSERHALPSDFSQIDTVLCGARWRWRMSGSS